MIIEVENLFGNIAVLLLKIFHILAEPTMLCEKCWRMGENKIYRDRE
ncbi:4595_t:CDS:2 [Gigaspora rosea]|nr:4595_t:CDS:2 [Gigaspora rosea]